jgi:hypothetical protein
MSVNVSARQLQHSGLVEDVAAALAGSGREPASLTLEITESVLVHDTEATIAVLGNLKALGVRLAIDDFGTGYSSLSYLQRFPVDVLKIDKSFIDGIGNGGEDAMVAQTIAKLGRSPGLETVAEGSRRPSSKPPSPPWAASTDRATTSPNPSTPRPSPNCWMTTARTTDSQPPPSRAADSEGARSVRRAV